MQAKEIKLKMSSVANIKKITRTMEMVSVAKMRRATDQAAGTRAYAQYALELLATLSNEREVSHPYLDFGAGDRTLFLIVGSNKGLCGGYNVNIAKAVKEKIVSESMDTKLIDVVAVGKQAVRVAQRLGLSVVAKFDAIGDKIEQDAIRSIYYVLAEKFDQGNYNSVFVAYTKFNKPMDYDPLVVSFIPVVAESITTVLPVASPMSDQPSISIPAGYVIEPEPADIIGVLLPTLLQSVVLQAVQESLASEHSSRMVAMKGATENAGNLLEDLRLTYNKARQEAITREIAEISAGADAV